MTKETIICYTFLLPEDENLLWEFLKENHKLEVVIDTTFVVSLREHIIQQESEVVK